MIKDAAGSKADSGEYVNRKYNSEIILFFSTDLFRQTHLELLCALFIGIEA